LQNWTVNKSLVKEQSLKPQRDGSLSLNPYFQFKGLLQLMRKEHLSFRGKTLTVCLVFLLRIFTVSANDTLATHLGIDQGLSNNAVTSIFQDHNGFMWFGTYDGLNRYDGHTFKVFRNIIGDSTSLQDNHVSNIESDALHNLWIGCESGLSIYNPAKSTFSVPLFKPWDGNGLQPLHYSVHAVQKIAAGDWMLAGVEGKGLVLFAKGTLSGKQIPLQKGRINEAAYSVTAIAFDSLRSNVWVFVNGFGLCRYDLNKQSLDIVTGAIKVADCLKMDSKGALWLGNEDGLFCYNADANSYSKNILPFSYKVVNLFEDRRNVMWIASDGGGVWSMPVGLGVPAPFVSRNGRSVVNSNAVYAVYEDRNGGKWIGTLRGGINVIQSRSSSFRHILYNDDEQNNSVNNFILSFCESQNGNLWIGTDGAGLRYWDRRKNSFASYVHEPSNPGSLSGNFITNILRDKDGDLWVASWFGGVNRLKEGAKTFEHFSCFNPKTASIENNAWLVYEDGKKRLWVSTTNEGTLYLFNRVENRFDVFDESINNVQCLAEDRQGLLWGGNYSSLFIIDPVAREHRIFPVGNTVRCIHEDNTGNFWVGTDGGGLLLFNRQNGKFKRFTTAEGLPSNTVLRMLEDRSGNLWLSTYNGLCKFNTAAKTCRNFYQSDGLQSNQFSFNAAIALKSGEFLFGGIKGFNVFYPDSVYDKKEAPPLFLTGLKINNKPVEEDDRFVTSRNFEKIEAIRLPYTQAMLSLDFVALEYNGADKIKYAYQLEGWDKAWNYSDNVRTANYSRLEEGTYRFKIKATNAAGVWGKETVLLSIVVLPPWYRTWWAYLVYALFLVGIVYLYITYNKKQERLKYEIKLALLEKEKEREVTEKKISFFTHISHEFRTPLTLIINPLKELLPAGTTDGDPKIISTVYRNARRLLSLVDQLLLFRKVESVDQQMRIEKFDMVEACNEVYLSFGQHALSKNIEFTFKGNERQIWIYGDKEKIEIILFNLLSNAFKYTEGAGKIALELSESEKAVEVVVKDSGCGVPADVGNQLFDSFYQAGNLEKTSHTGFGVGLYVSKKLALAHQGELSYTSKPGDGTAFCLLLKKGKEHFASQCVSDDYKSGETLLHELVEEPATANLLAAEESVAKNKAGVIDKLTSNLPAMVIVDDNAEIRAYLTKIFADSFVVYEAADGAEGYDLVLKESPDIVISDVMMKNVDGIELCQKIKANPVVAHTPVVLLTASSSDKIKLKGIEGGAEDYITKPFDREIIVARVQNILKSKNRLQQYFFNAVTLKPIVNIAGEHKAFIETCMTVVEAHVDNPNFTIQTFCKEIGMSHPGLYKKVKAVSGLTVNVFIRYIRLRKAAELLITTDKTIQEVTYLTGFNDVRYFREQFQKLFEMKPSDFIKRYRKVLGGKPVDS
jgi:signal transduction histidine kinase/ligand-binding sensor domain-containing protein/DNA-binding response OmpR family regulator